MEQKKSRRSLRVALVLGAAIGGTALVGWGGLAAWTAYTQNSGNAFTAGSLSHTNNVSCTSGSTPTICNAIVTASNMGSGWSGASGTVVIKNTGSLPSTFTLSSPSGDLPSGSLCADLNLTITDGESAPATVYSSTNGISTSSGIPSSALKADNGDSSWAQNDQGTFTFSVTPNNPTYENNQSAPQESCTFDVLFSQQG